MIAPFPHKLALHTAIKTAFPGMVIFDAAHPIHAQSWKFTIGANKFELDTQGVIKQISGSGKDVSGLIAKVIETCQVRNTEDCELVRNAVSLLLKL